MCEVRSAEQKCTAKRQLEKMLISHLRAEEAVFYPLLREKHQSRHPALKASEEHAVMEGVFMQLLKLDVESEGWLAKAEVLREFVDRHLRHEKTQIFRLARSLIPPERMAALPADFAEEKVWHMRWILVNFKKTPPAVRCSSLGVVPDLAGAVN